MNSEHQERIIAKISREFQEVLTVFNDPNTIEIMLNSDGKLWIEQFGKDMFVLNNNFSEIKAKSIITSVASYIDTVINADNPILECEFPLDGSRFEALIPPVVSKPTFTIRKKAIKIFTLDDYENTNIITKSINGNRICYTELHFSKLKCYTQLHFKLHFITKIN